MLKYIVPFFWVVLLFGACSGNKTQKDVIPRDQMISLLTDLHIVDGSLYNVMSVNPDSLYKYGNGKYLALFKRHHVDSSAFRKSLKYYAENPAEFETMYVEIQKHISDKIDSANKQLSKPGNSGRPKAE